MPDTEGGGRDDFHLTLELVYPAEEGSADLDGFRQLPEVIAYSGDLCIFSEFVIHRDKEGRCEFRRYGFLHSAEYLKDAGEVLVRVLRMFDLDF